MKHTLRTPWTLSLPALTLLSLGVIGTSCGGSSDPASQVNAGYGALNAGNPTDAVARFDAAIEAMGGDVSHAEYLRAALGRVEALAAVDPGAARNGLLALASELPGAIGDADYNRIGGLLASGGHFDAAIDVMDAGMKAFPESGHLAALLDNIKEAAEGSGASGALDRLKGLGYIGD